MQCAALLLFVLVISLFSLLVKFVDMWGGVVERIFVRSNNSHVLRKD